MKKLVYISVMAAMPLLTGCGVAAVGATVAGGVVAYKWMEGKKEERRQQCLINYNHYTATTKDKNPLSLDKYCPQED